MPAGHFLDLDSWTRRAQFEFFLDYEQPFFQVCAPVRVTATREHCRQQGASFSLACWFLATRAANRVEPFRYRLREQRVWVHDRIGVATTILRDDDSFAFCHMPLADRFDDFEPRAREAIQAALQPSATMDDRPEQDALIHGSTLPWVAFTAVSHPRRARTTDSVPKIIIGRVEKGHRGELTMPVAVDVHHALADGLHVARFFERFEALLDRPEIGLAPASAAELKGPPTG